MGLSGGGKTGSGGGLTGFCKARLDRIKAGKLASMALNFVKDYLKTDKDIESYLKAALMEKDPQYFLNALALAAQLKGMSKIARLSGLGKEKLQIALRPGAKPHFETVFRIMAAIQTSIDQGIAEGSQV